MYQSVHSLRSYFAPRDLRIPCEAERRCLENFSQRDITSVAACKYSETPTNFVFDKSFCHNHRKDVQESVPTRPSARAAPADLRSSVSRFLFRQGGVHRHWLTMRYTRTTLSV